MSVPDFTPEDFCSIDELAVIVGLNRKTLYGLANRKKLPGARHVGRAIRIHKPTVLRWFQERA